MQTNKKIITFMQKNNGYITNKDAMQIGINKFYLSKLAKAGIIERMGPGIYGDPDLFEDEMFNLQYRFKKGIFSYNTALFLHEMTDRTPRKFDMTFPRPYNTAALPKEKIRAYSQKKDLYNLGIVTEITPNGNVVKVYNIEKTLCDLVRGKNRKDAELISQAMNKYVRLKNKDITKLMKYAEIMGVDKIIRNYMEVLL
ncbi:abortive phage infection protein [Pediococcus ethanolidurans]|uniref:type IV toxin-antitoxin system AbiEi family antitoxin domain-containing protein n=1 Tax=Pediococcus ethanolidurans TaxID=319653 RepID=UPI00295493E1|nr:type IV toxin-antitoxin system AbiEi family antitoxin domain-containing protein [Pediococcus ethanolidurans]MDV7719662.1 abortive phage infection protein [Pediococcus ethanolidurans]